MFVNALRTNFLTDCLIIKIYYTLQLVYTDHQLYRLQSHINNIIILWQQAQNDFWHTYQLIIFWCLCVNGLSHV